MYLLASSCISPTCWHVMALLSMIKYLQWLSKTWSKVDYPTDLLERVIFLHFNTCSSWLSWRCSPIFLRRRQIVFTSHDHSSFSWSEHWTKPAAVVKWFIRLHLNFLTAVFFFFRTWASFSRVSPKNATSRSSNCRCKNCRPARLKPTTSLWEKYR